MKKSELITITLNDRNTVVNAIRNENGSIYRVKTVNSLKDVYTVEKKRSNGKKDVFYYTSDYRAEISAADRAFLDQLPEYAARRVFKLAYDEGSTTPERLNAVKPENVHTFYNELKKEKFFQVKKAHLSAIIEKIKNNETLTALEYETLRRACIESVTDGSGKMKDMKSISTAVFLNERCKANAMRRGWICSKCYAMKYAAMRADLARKLEINTLLYTAVVLPFDVLPVINAQFVRLESFGDLNNVTQCINYFNITLKNDHASVAQWSKNPDIIHETITAGYKKPENMIIVYSSPVINCTAAAILEKYGYFIDKVFTVYDKKFIAANDVKINCGARNCLTCLNCYKKGGAAVISEKLK